VKLLTDENIDPRITAWFRAEMYDVVAIAEGHAGAMDTDILGIANLQSRVIVTRDKDFGELVYRLAFAVPGVVLIRYQSLSRTEYLNTLALQWPLVVPHLPGHFIVLTNQSFRIRPL